MGSVTNEGRNRMLFIEEISFPLERFIQSSTHTRFSKLHITSNNQLIIVLRCAIRCAFRRATDRVVCTSITFLCFLFTSKGPPLGRRLPCCFSFSLLPPHGAPKGSSKEEGRAGSFHFSLPFPPPPLDID